MANRILTPEEFDRECERIAEALDRAIKSLVGAVKPQGNGDARPGGKQQNCAEPK